MNCSELHDQYGTVIREDLCHTETHEVHELELRPNFAENFIARPGASAVFKKVKVEKHIHDEESHFDIFHPQNFVSLICVIFIVKNSLREIK